MKEHKFQGIRIHKRKRDGGKQSSINMDIYPQVQSTNISNIPYGNGVIEMLYLLTNLKTIDKLEDEFM